MDTDMDDFLEDLFSADGFFSWTGFTGITSSASWTHTHKLLNTFAQK